MPSALYNPNLTLPGVASIFAIQPRDILHICLWDIREPLTELLNNKQLLRKADRILLQERMSESRKFLPYCRRTCPSLDSIKMWKAKECLNFVLIAPWLFKGVLRGKGTSGIILEYFSLTATIHFLLTAGEVHTEMWKYLLDVLYVKQRQWLHRWFPADEAILPPASALAGQGAILGSPPVAQGAAAGAVGAEVISSSSESDNCGSSCMLAASQRDDVEAPPPPPPPPLAAFGQASVPPGTVPIRMRNTLGNHQVFHFPADIDHWGPPCNVSTSVFEHAQGNISHIAGMHTKMPALYGFEHYTARILHCLSEVQHSVEGTSAAAVAAANQDLNILHDRQKREVIQYWGMTLVPGAVAMQIVPWPPDEGTNARASMERRELPMVEDVFRFFVIKEVHVDEEELVACELVPPDHRLPLMPFTLREKGPSGDNLISVPFSACQRIVATIPISALKNPATSNTVVEQSSKGSKGRRVVIPTRFI